MTAANNYWLYGGDWQPGGQARHQSLGRFRTLANARASGGKWLSQHKNPSAHWWHVVDIRRAKIVAESEANP